MVILKSNAEPISLFREELELRVQALTNSEVNKSKLLKELEIRQFNFCIFHSMKNITPLDQSIKKVFLLFCLDLKIPIFPVDRIQSLASDSVKSSKSSDLIRSKDEEICRLKEEKSATELEIVQLRNECEAMKSIVKDLEDNLVCLQVTPKKDVN